MVPGSVLSDKPSLHLTLTEDWARQCNMGAARGLSMSDVWATDGVVGRWKLFLALAVSSWIPTPYILALLRQVALEPWALYNRGVCYVPESVGVTSGQSWIPTSGLPSAPWVGYTPWAYSPAAPR